MASDKIDYESIGDSTLFNLLLEIDMLKTVFARGNEIYAAAVEGAKRGYNRSSDNYENYEEALKGTYAYTLNSLNWSTRKAFLQSTKGEWRNAYLPLTLMMQHNHIAGEPSEPHARVLLQGENIRFFDIPWESWQRFERQNADLDAYVKGEPA